MIPGRKDVVEDWTGYNEAVRARAERARRRVEESRPAARPMEPAAPSAPPVRPAVPPAPDPVGTFVRILLAVVLLVMLWLVLRAHPEWMESLRTGGGDLAAASPAPQAGTSEPGPSQPPAPASEAPPPVVTNYTIFHRVQHDSGTAVVTGWNFRRSGDARPESQFCYLSLPIRGSLEETLNLGTNELRRGGPMPDAALAAGLSGTSWASAPDKCQWFSNRVRSGGSGAAPALTPFGSAP